MNADKRIHFQEHTKDDAIIAEAFQDLDNPRAMRQLIQQCQKHSLLSGVNENGEQVLLSMSKDGRFRIETNQKNGWVRVNYYSMDGLQEEEIYEGRWNKED